MTITIADPDVKAFIQRELESGHYSSAESVVNVAMKQFISDCRPSTDDELSDAMVARLNEACDRGERNEPGHSPEEALAIVLSGNRHSRSVRS